ncbi:MarR family winged helix-turn-helix transcriptional regulator [Arhodomonas sp. AD133]|uniref:MarR family winged helix-turn-helix transcriptional regulator n=1 Tax=Arhodomonas sp. AD133 TaxID=3415009 RepID=UPI003EB9284A
MVKNSQPNTRQGALPDVFAVFNEIGIIAQLTETKMERALPDGLRMSHFSVLNHFVRRPYPATPVQLAQAFQVTKAAITNTLNRLETRGLVEITPSSEDRRSKQVAITPRGREAHTACLEALRPELAQVEAAFGRQAFTEALPFLHQLRQWLDEERNAR